MMKPWEKYLEQLNADEKLLHIYRRLREEFQKEGWSEEDLEKPPYYTNTIMKLFHAFGDEQKRLGDEINSYFGKVEFSQYMDYIQDKMKKINHETPLNKKDNHHGSKKRRD